MAITLGLVTLGTGIFTAAAGCRAGLIREKVGKLSTKVFQESQKTNPDRSYSIKMYRADSLASGIEGAGKLMTFSLTIGLLLTVLVAAGVIVLEGLAFPFILGTVAVIGLIIWAGVEISIALETRAEDSEIRAEDHEVRLNS